MEVVFVHFCRFDSSQAIRKVKFPEGTIQAWAVQDQKVLKELLEQKAHKSPVTLELAEPSTNYSVMAIDYDAMDKYVCGWSNEEPRMVPFNPDLHCISMHLEEEFCSCGCGASEGIFYYFDHPYQVALISKTGN